METIYLYCYYGKYNLSTQMRQCLGDVTESEPRWYILEVRRKEQRLVLFLENCKQKTPRQLSL